MSDMLTMEPVDSRAVTVVRLPAIAGNATAVTSVMRRPIDQRAREPQEAAAFEEQKA